MGVDLWAEMGIEHDGMDELRVEWGSMMGQKVS